MASTAHTMFGSFLFNCTGVPRDHNRNDDLHKLPMPVLIMTAEHDDILPEFVFASAELIPNARGVVFRNCAHMPFWEDPINYNHAFFGVFDLAPDECFCCDARENREGQTTRRPLFRRHDHPCLNLSIILALF